GAATAVIMEGTVVSVAGETSAASRVVPNPASEEWTISYGHSLRRISIVDVTGVHRWTMAPSPDQRQVTIGTGDAPLPAGTYMVVLDGDHGMQVLPLVIVRVTMACRCCRW
nr:T9SS type A sorting domain-containing protein [Candidatus Kapabacteria bacterium]